MMKKSIMMLCAVVALSLLLVWTNVQAQTKIKDNTVPGSPLTPDSTAIMELESTHRGMLPPRMDSIQRNGIGGGNPDALIDGMVVYNTDEQCIDYYSKAAEEWLPLCGAQPPAKLAVDCGAITIGQTDTPFVLGVPLGTQSLQVPITVNTLGNYTIIATPTKPNGYSFSYSGYAGAQGTQLVTVPVQGTPVKDETDTLNVLINNQSLPNCQSLTIRVINTAANFSIVSSSGDAVSGTYNNNQDHFGGVYAAGVAMSTANTDTVAVHLPAGGKAGQNVWSISATANGVTFANSGRFSDALVTNGGDTLIVLKASGTPVATVMPSMKLTYTTNSPAMDGVTVTDTVKMGVRSPLIWFAPSNWYDVFNTSATSDPMTIFTQNMSLFGTSQQSKVIVSTTPTNSGSTKGTTGLTFVNQTNFSTIMTAKPDIVYISYSIDITPYISQLQQYVKAGGVLILCGTETTSDANMQSFFNGLYGGNDITVHDENTNNAAYQFTNSSFDVISGGPFGTFGASGSGAQYNWWGEDGGYGIYLSGLLYADPSASIYSSAGNNINFIDVDGSASMFKSGKYNLWWVGDGGWTHVYAYQNGNQTAGYPFRYTGTGANCVPSQQTLQDENTNNAALFCNVMAWALTQQQVAGINSAK